eukprot:scaffold8766_cov67-Skeletonema_dohrnii-CCMP3373.AAC.1
MLLRRVAVGLGELSREPMLIGCVDRLDSVLLQKIVAQRSAAANFDMVKSERGGRRWRMEDSVNPVSETNWRQSMVSST